MKRPEVLSWVVATALGIGVLLWLLSLGGDVWAATARTTAVGVTQREYRIALGRERVRPGTVKLNISNFGEDAHDIVVRSPKGREIARSPEIRPGDRYTLRFRASRVGRYTLVCTVADHEARGMRSRLRVSRRER